MLHQRGDTRLAHRRILLAIAPRSSDRADALPVDKNRIAADENGEAAFMLSEDAEGFLAGQRILVLVGGPAMPRRGKGLVERDLHARDLAAVEPAQGYRIARRVGDAEHFRHAELLGLGLSRVEGNLRL